MKGRVPARPGDRRTQTRSRVSPSPGIGANTYVYGIVRWPLPAGLLKALGTGVGDPPRAVRAVRSGKFAALVSDVSAPEMSAEGVRGLRRDMKAHSAVVNALAADVTVVPARFGVVLPDEQTLVAEVLDAQRQALEAQFNRLDGMVEITLRAAYIEEQILREVLEARPDLRRPPAGRSGRAASMAAESRIELGRQISIAIQDEQNRDARWLIEVLGPAVRDVRLGKPLNDLMVLNASLLVERAALSKFDRLLEKVAAEMAGRMTFDCVGPLPPFSFVELRL